MRELFTWIRANRAASLAVLVSALGYFVDAYDLLIFGAMRVPSLRAIGVPEESLVSEGFFILNLQMTGMIIGGMLFGIIGDKFGRIQAMFGSIVLYSVANLLNAFVETVPQYAALRFITGIGLAGEVGGSITLVSELLPQNLRGYGTTFVASIGVLGSVAAGLAGEYIPWRMAYVIGGVAGLLLLLFRVGVHESSLFHETTKDINVRRGDLRDLLGTPATAIRFLGCVFLGVPVWFCQSIVIGLTPEITKALGYGSPLTTASAVFASGIGIGMGDLLSGLCSQYFQSRKKALVLFYAICAAGCVAALTSPVLSNTAYLMLMFLVGLGCGFWCIFLTTTAEQFGTNIRALATTAAPNIVRASTLLFTTLFQLWKPSLGVIGATQAVGIVAFILAGIGLSIVKETFYRELGFLEGEEPQEVEYKAAA